MSKRDQVADLFGALSKYTRLRDRALAGAHSMLAASAETAACRALLPLKHGAMRSRDLAAALVADPSTVSRYTAQLVSEGLVRREADPDDGRATLLTLTDAGRERAQQLFDVRRELIVELVADWSEDEFAVFVAQLNRFVDAAESSYLTQQPKGDE